MNCVITSVTFDDQEYVRFTVDLTDENKAPISTHSIVLPAVNLIDANVLTEVKRAVKQLLILELDLTQYVGETFVVENLYRKAYA